MLSPSSTSTHPADDRPSSRATPGAGASGGRFAALTPRLDAATPYLLSLFRIVVGLLFACHGAGSLFGWVGPASGPEFDTTDFGSWPEWYAGVIQFFGGGLVLLGLGSRSAALICSGSMAYAYFSEHQSIALWPLDNGGEAAVLYCWAFLLLVLTGPGRLSLDRLLTAGRRSAARSPQR